MQGHKSFEPNCHNCQKVLDAEAFKAGRYVSDMQAGYIYCDEKCHGADQRKLAPITQAAADEAEAYAVRQFLAFTKLRDIVIEARQRADSIARLERSLEAVK